MINLIKNLPWPWRLAELQAENKRLQETCDRLATQPSFREVTQDQPWMASQMLKAVEDAKEKVVEDLARILNAPALRMLQDAMREWPNAPNDRAAMLAAYEEREDFFQIEVRMPRIVKTIRVAPRRLPY